VPTISPTHLLRFLTGLAQTTLGTLAIGVVGWSDDEETADHHPSVAPDLTTVALVILAALLFVANLVGVWWLVAELAGR